MPYLNYQAVMDNYRRVLLHTIKWVSVLISIVAAFILVLALTDVLIGLHWGYPWWSILAALMIIVIALAIRSTVVVALDLHSRTSS